jgi:osmotically-inducible protein OsmY
VQAALLISPRTRNLTVTVRVERGEVSASGILAPSDLEQEIVRLIGSTPGVKKVVTDFESLPIEYMYP